MATFDVAMPCTAADGTVDLVAAAEHFEVDRSEIAKSDGCEPFQAFGKKCVWPKEKAVHRPGDPYGRDFNLCTATEKGYYATCIACHEELLIDLMHWSQKDIHSFAHRLGLQGPVTFKGDFAKRTCRQCFPREAPSEWCTNCSELLVGDTPSRRGNLSRAQKTKYPHGQRKCKHCSEAAGPAANRRFSLWSGVVDGMGYSMDLDGCIQR